MTIAEQLLNTFRGRDGVTAVGDANGFHPEESQVTAEMLEGHLSQTKCLGFYVLSEESQCYVTCVDFDNKPETPDPEWRSKAEQVYYLLANIGLTPLVEISQSAEGAHVWLCFSKPVDAWVARAWWRGVSDRLGIKFKEVFPKQDRLAKGGIGNLVRFPLWNKSHFADVESDWAEIEPVTALSQVAKTDDAALRLMAHELGFYEQMKPEASVQYVSGETQNGLPGRVLARLSRQHSLLARRWFGDTTGMQDPSRSSLVQSIACELVRTYVPTLEVEQALRYWCDRFGYEKGLRTDWIRVTTAKAYDFVLSRHEEKSREATTLDKACEEYLDRIENGTEVVVASGVPELDGSIGGAGYGEMIVIAARPGHGKSAFALQWLQHAAVRGVRSLILSEEMSRMQLGKRAIQGLTYVEQQDWSAEIGQVRSDVKAHFQYRDPIYIQESCVTVERAEEVIDQFCSVYGVGLVAVDYLQLLRGRNQKRYEDVTEVSSRLTQAAKRNGCVLLACCQCSREVEKRKGYVPQNSDLRESGQIEQDADVIIFVQWPLKFDPQYDDPDEYRIYVTKRRNGEVKNPVMITQFNPHRQVVGALAFAGMPGETEF